MYCVNEMCFTAILVFDLFLIPLISVEFYFVPFFFFLSWIEFLFFKDLFANFDVVSIKLM